MIEFIEKHPAISVALASGILTIVGIIVRVLSDVILSKINKSNSISIEREKLNSNLILKAIDTDNYRKSLNNLKFMRAIGAIKDDDGKLDKVINGETEVNIPALRTGKVTMKATNEGSNFSVQSGFNGECSIKLNEVIVKLDKGSIKLTDRYPYESNYIQKIEVGLGTYLENGRWHVAQKGESLEIDKTLKKGETIEIDPRDFKINRESIEDIKDYWVIFTIWQKESKEKGTLGTSYVHFKELDKI
jgi:hypothetical protein